MDFWVCFYETGDKILTVQITSEHFGGLLNDCNVLHSIQLRIVYWIWIFWINLNFSEDSECNVCNLMRFKGFGFRTEFEKRNIVRFGFGWSNLLSLDPRWIQIFIDLDSHTSEEIN